MRNVPLLTACFGLAALLFVQKADSKLVAYVNTDTATLGNSGTAVINTGISTSEVGLKAVPFPPLGANDSLEITSLWNTGGVATNSKTLIVRVGTVACAPLATCVGLTGGNSVVNQLMNTAALISNSVYTIVRNAGATNSQVFQTNGAGLQSFGASNAVVGAAAVDTSAGGFVNFNCATTTASTDTCTLSGYTVRVIRGR